MASFMSWVDFEANHDWVEGGFEGTDARFGPYQLCHQEFVSGVHENSPDTFLTFRK